MSSPETTQLHATVPSATGSPTAEELAALKAENAQLKDIMRKCNRDGHRLKDFIIACNGPGEMIRFQEAATNNKGVDIFLSYLDSLWRELDKAKSEANK